MTGGRSKLGSLSRLMIALTVSLQTVHTILVAGLGFVKERVSNIAGSPYHYTAAICSKSFFRLAYSCWKIG